MERKIEKFLKKWQKDILRKPLIIYGPKQIGKTYTALSFGKKEYKNTVYFNTENNEQLFKLFAKEKITEKIILNLSLISKETILQDDTLIIFDNIKDLEIIKGLKLFGSEKSNYHIIGITSKKGKLSEFKGEELQFKGMNEMDFEEYLWARNEKNLAEIIKESFIKRKTNPFHKLALDIFYEYIATGGLPEAVEARINGKSDNEIDIIKQKLIKVYEHELLYNNVLIDIPRGLDVIISVPRQLEKENKKFQYGLLGTGKRKKEYESTIKFLTTNQILIMNNKVSTIKSPLSSCKEKDSFKIFMPDDGLLYTMLHLNKKQFLTDEEKREILFENHIAKTLSELGYSLYYYQSEGKAEVNFIVQNRMGQIIPIELTTKANSKAKSLAVFMKKFTVPVAYRITENNFSTKKDVRYIPIYAIFCINETKV